MKVTSQDLLDMGIADKIINEPNGAAHIDPKSAFQELKKEILKTYDEIKGIPTEELISKRMEKYNNIGDWIN